MDPAGGEEVAEPHVAVLRDETVGPAGECGGVQLEQGGQVVTVGNRDQVVDWLSGVRTCRGNRINLSVMSVQILISIGNHPGG